MVPIWLFILVIGITFIGAAVYFLQAFVGTLRIDRSNPDKETYRFDVTDLDKLGNKKFIILRVDDKADLSQK